MKRSIYRSKQHGDVIKILTDKNPETNRAVFSYIKDLVCFAAVLGFDNGRRVPFDRGTDKVESIEWHTFQNTQADHFIYLIAIAEKGDLKILKYKGDLNESSEISDDNMFAIFEEYANGGFEIIKSWLNKNPGDPYGSKALLVAMEKAGYMKREVHELQEPDF